MVDPDSHRVSRALWYVWTCLGSRRFRLQGYHLLCRTFPGSSTNNLSPMMAAPQPRKYMYLWFRLFPVRSPLLRESRLMSFPRGTEMFHFPRFASYYYVFIVRYCDSHHSGLPHSDIPGSKLARQLPEAFRSLPRPSSLASAKALAARSL